MLSWKEAPLLAQGGREFFAEGKMPGGFDEKYFINELGGLMRAGVARVAGAFGEDDGIRGALCWVTHPGLFSPTVFATEVFWFMRPQFRGSLGEGIRLVNFFEDWAAHHGPMQLAMIHLMNLQPEKLEAFYLRRGYRLVEKHYVKDVL